MLKLTELRWQARSLVLQLNQKELQSTRQSTRPLPELMLENFQSSRFAELRQKRFAPGDGGNDEGGTAEPDLVDRLFGTDEKEELDEILRELKIEKDF